MDKDSIRKKIIAILEGQLWNHSQQRLEFSFRLSSGHSPTVYEDSLNEAAHGAEVSILKECIEYIKNI